MEKAVTKTHDSLCACVTLTISFIYWLNKINLQKIFPIVRLSSSWTVVKEKIPTPRHQENLQIMSKNRLYNVACVTRGTSISVCDRKCTDC